MTDPLGTATTGVALAEKAVRVIRWFRHRLPDRSFGGSGPGDRHHGFELRPFSYSIDLSGLPPSVQVEFLAINYLKMPIELREVKISLLTGTGHPDLGGIGLDREITLAARTSFLVFCSRALADSEAQLTAPTPRRPTFMGSIAFVARGRIGRKELQYGPVAAKTIIGWVLDQPPATADTA